MKSNNSALLLCVLAGAIHAQSPAPKPGSVTGIVTNALTGQPVRKATVTLHASGLAYVAISDAAGRFHIIGVPPGRNYFLDAKCPGFDLGTQTAPRINRVVGGEDVSGVSVRLSPLGVIAGKVVNADGDPIQRASVQAQRIFYQTGARRIGPWRYATTDDRGEYRLFDLQPGRYFVLATPQNYSTPDPNIRKHSDQPEESQPPTYFPSSTDLTGATGIAVELGAEIDGTNIRVPTLRVYHIRGKAVDAESGQAVHGASVQNRACAFGLKDSLWNPEIALRPDGTFDISGVVPGPYCLTLRQGQQGHASFAQQNVTVANRDVEGVILSVAAGLNLAGTVTFETPLSDKQKDVRMYLSFLDPFGNDMSVAIKDTSFVLKDAFPLPYRLQQMQLPPGYYLKSMQYGERDVSDGNLTVTSGGKPLTLVAASDTAKVTVEVLKPDGTAAPGVEVSLAPQGRFALRQDLVRYISTNIDGTATLWDVAPGDYKLFALEDHDQGTAQTLDLLKLLESRSVSVTVQSNDSLKVQAKLITLDLIDDAKTRMQ